MSHYKAYLRFDEFFGREVVVIPLNDITTVYNPIKKAEEVLSLRVVEEDVLRDVKDMILDVVEATNVKEVGISGSILVNLYTCDSDIDIVIYGMKNGFKVYQYLSEVVEKDARYKRYSFNNIHALFRKRSLETPITIDKLVEQESRKVLEGLFKGREYFIRLIKYPWEEPSYNSYRCIKLGKALVKLRILDASEAIYTPCRYRVEVVEHLNGVEVDIEEVYSLRGRFAEIAYEDEVVMVFGTVERIEIRNSKTYYRLYLGDEGDYMLLLR